MFLTVGFLLYRVQGESMMPSLRPDDYLLVRRLKGNRHQPAREDIVVVAMSEQSQLKRIVALPGESIVFADGLLFINGERLVERYLRGLPAYLGLDNCEFELGSDEYFVMGDNRTRSTDSRHYGPVRSTQIEGRVVCPVWPPRRWAML